MKPGEFERPEIILKRAVYALISERPEGWPKRRLVREITRRFKVPPAVANETVIGLRDKGFVSRDEDAIIRCLR